MYKYSSFTNGGCMFNCQYFQVIFIVGLMLCKISAPNASTYSEDSLVVRQILDTNGHQKIGVNNVTTASEGRIVSLNLSNVPLGRFDFNISILPSVVGKLTGLQSLYITSTQLTVIPAEICSLSALISLSFYGNQLTNFPPGIERLTNLVYLNLSINSIETIPEQIGQLSKLEVLEICCNKIDTLPKSIGNLALLEKLALNNNQLSKLPQELGRLSNLTFLKLNDNQLSTLPDSLIILTNLNSLSCRRNKLCSLSTNLAAFVTSKDQEWLQSQQCKVSIKGAIKHVINKEGSDQYRCRVYDLKGVLLNEFDNFFDINKARFSGLKGQRIVIVKSMSGQAQRVCLNRY